MTPSHTGNARTGAAPAIAAMLARCRGARGADVVARPEVSGRRTALGACELLDASTFRPAAMPPVPENREPYPGLSSGHADRRLIASEPVSVASSRVVGAAAVMPPGGCNPAVENDNPGCGTRGTLQRQKVSTLRAAPTVSEARSAKPQHPTASVRKHGREAAAPYGVRRRAPSAKPQHPTASDREHPQRSRRSIRAARPPDRHEPRARRGRLRRQAPRSSGRPPRRRTSPDRVA